MCNILSDESLTLQDHAMAQSRPIRARAQSLLRSSLVWDNHTCLPLRPDDTFLPQIERYRRAGVNIVSINVGFGTTPWTECLRVISYMRRWFAVRSDMYRLISTVQDVHQCKHDGKLGVAFDIEGMYPVQEDTGLVQTFYELGVRWMLIAYNRNNAAGGGCMDNDCGLTGVGRAIIDEMDRVGMVLCLSHTGARTVAEALDYCRHPAIFSHSNPYGDTCHGRNISDDLMRACAKKGGVVGLSGIGPFLGANTDLVQPLLRQLRYVIDLIGPRHVGLGLDYVFDSGELDEYVRQNPAAFPPEMNITGHMGMVEPEAWGEIADGLAGDNLTDEHIRGILGGNWLRVASEVWR